MQRETEKLIIEGAVMIRDPLHSDSRGYFFESYNLTEFYDLGIPNRYKQDNISFSHAGVIRGLHFQRFNPQGKLVRAITGKVWDVILDVRQESPTFRRWCAVMLDSPNMAVYVPEGCAHGFAALTDAVVGYKCTTLYEKDGDAGINAMDPALRIAWPIGCSLRSERDQRLPTLDEYLKGM